MTEVRISRDDIDAVAQTVDTTGLPEAPKALLSAIVAAIRDVVHDEEPVVTVTVDIVTALQDEFATAFTPDLAKASAATDGVMVTVSKIGR
jgi:hypothetical protein